MPSVTQRIEFECCYIEPPNILNAHRYRWEVTVEGPQRYDDFGKIIDFKLLKSYMESEVPNNAFLYCSIQDVEDQAGNYIGQGIALSLFKFGVKTYDLGSTICAETLLNHICCKLQSVLDSKEPGITVVHSKLQETSNSWVEWKPSFTISCN